MLPKQIRAEIKFTTGSAIQLAERELRALRDPDGSAVGLLAVLFWCQDRAVDGQWQVTDAEELAPFCSSQTISVSKEDMRRAAVRAKPQLKGVREHLRSSWPSFLQAFLDEALAGHAVLCEELQRCHCKAQLRERLPMYEVLEDDHRRAVEQVISQHGESVAGHIFQDLFAYLVGMLGYREVTINPVGVPDVTLADLIEANTSGQPSIRIGPFTEDEIRRLVELCSKAGDLALAARIGGSLGEQR